MTKIRSWTVGEINQLKELFPRTETKDIAKLLDRSEGSIRGKASSLMLKRDLDYMRKKRMESKIYAMYKGDDLLVTGTLAEIAEHQNTTIDAVRFMSCPSHHKRAKKAKGDWKVVIKID